MTAMICETCKKKGYRCAPNIDGTCGAYEPKVLTWFEKIKLMSIEKFAEWLDKHGRFDSSPWMEWFDCKYCNNCEPVMCHYEGSEREFPCAWCELERKCKFFPEMDEAPGNRDIIKMWLESEVKK